MAVAALSVVLFARSLSAQLAVDRSEIVLTSKSPSALAGSFAVTNNGRVPAAATLSLADWDRTGNGDNQFYPPATHPGSCGKFMHLDPAALRLEPGASQVIKVSVDPGAARTSECWGIAFVQTEPATVAANSRVTRYVIRTGVKIYVVAAGASKGGEVVAFVAVGDAPPDSVRKLDLVFQNSGTRHETATGTVELRRADNSVAGKIVIPTLYMLPGATRSVVLPVPILPRGEYVALAVLDYGGSDLAAAQLPYEVP